MVSRQHMASLIDQRGYIFTLPTLGLPDLAGEWVTIKGAIGVKQQALPFIKDKSNTATLPMRTPAVDAKIIDLEYEGALWLLPFVTPEGSVGDPPEVFNVKVQRLPPSAVRDPSRMKVRHKIEWICLTPPEGMTAYLAYLAAVANRTADKFERERISSSSGSALSVPPSYACNKSPEARMRKEKGKGSDKWQALAGETLDGDWCRSIFYKTVTDSLQSGKPHDPKGVTLILREHPAWGGDTRSLDYAVVGVDEDESGEFEQDRWKPLPPQAFKPGAERRLVNLAREKAGKRPFEEHEWPPGPPSFPW